MAVRPSAALLVAIALAAPQQKPAARSPFEEPPVESDVALLARIDASIARGEKWLLEAQGKQGSWNNEERSQRTGFTELALYALSSSTELELPASPTSAAVERGLAFVRRVPHLETYALSLLLLALDARAAPRWERTSLAKMSAAERERYRYPRRLSADDKRWIEKTAAELLDHRFKGVWSYTRNAGTGDISNGQFALLGLRAAARCSVAIDPAVWKESIDYFLKYQDDDGPPAKFSVPRFGPGRIVEVVAIDAKQRCWGYTFSKGGSAPVGNDSPTKRGMLVASFTLGASGTHAAIGIASLQIARDELQRAMLLPSPGKAKGPGAVDRATVDRAIRDGLGWLAGHWNLEWDPGGGFPYYYLYSIERVGALLGERFVAGHDWYREGASILLSRQLEAGAWPSDSGELGALGAPDVVTTSFALLFLRRATAPAVVTPILR